MRLLRVGHGDLFQVHRRFRCHSSLIFILDSCPIGGGVAHLEEHSEHFGCSRNRKPVIGVRRLELHVEVVLLFGTKHANGAKRGVLGDTGLLPGLIHEFDLGRCRDYLQEWVSHFCFKFLL